MKVRSYRTSFDTVLEGQALMSWAGPRSFTQWGAKEMLTAKPLLCDFAPSTSYLCTVKAR